MKKRSILMSALFLMFFSAGDALATSTYTTAGTSANTSKSISSKGTIAVASATYGANCTKKSVKGNATNHLKVACDGKTKCEYIVATSNIGDPFPGCKKDYAIEYSCGGKALKVSLPAEAAAQPPVVLNCEGTSKSSKSSATTSKSTAAPKE
jgi:hypothetical protein